MRYGGLLVLIIAQGYHCIQNVCGSKTLQAKEMSGNFLWYKWQEIRKKVHNRIFLIVSICLRIYRRSQVGNKMHFGIYNISIARSQNGPGEISRIDAIVFVQRKYHFSNDEMLQLANMNINCRRNVGSF